MSSPVPVVRQAGEGEQMWFAGGGVFTWKATAEETGGAFLLFEDQIERGKTTPLHLHPHEDEAFYVLEGEILVHVDGEEHRVGPGGFAFAPRGVPHAFMATEPGRILALLTPGSAESFYREAGETVRSPEDAERPADIDRLRSVAEGSPSIELLGPPPFAPLEAGAR